MMAFFLKVKPNWEKRRTVVGYDVEIAELEDSPDFPRNVLDIMAWDTLSYAKQLEIYNPSVGLPSQLNCPITAFYSTENTELYLRNCDHREWMNFTSMGPFEYVEIKTTHPVFLPSLMKLVQTDSTLQSYLDAVNEPYVSREADDNVCLWQHFTAQKADSIALVDEDEASLTYQDIAFAVNHLSETFRSRGLAAGARALVIGIVSRRCYVSQLAFLRCGATTVMIGIGETPEYLANVAELGGCSFGLSLDADFDIASVPHDLTKLTYNPGKMKDCSISPSFVPRSSPATILFSSGSTGKPKGVV
jgi:hypothetical protein